LPWRVVRWCRSHPRLAAATTLILLLFTAGSLSTWHYVAKLEAEAKLVAGQLEQAQQVALVQRQAAHEATVHAARAAARRGDWHRALIDYQQAIDNTGPDWLRLRVERLFGFFAVNDRKMLARELEDLASRTDLGRLGAMFHLVRGAYFL